MLGHSSSSSMVGIRSPQPADKKAGMFKRLKNSILNTISSKKVTPREVEELFRQAIEKAGGDKVNSDPEMIEGLLSGLEDAISDKYSEAWEEVSKRKTKFSYSKGTYPFDILITEKINLKRVQWKRKELYQNGKKVYKKLKTAYSVLPDLPDLNLPKLPDLPNMPDLPDLPDLAFYFDIPKLNLDFPELDLPGLDVPNGDIQFPGIPNLRALFPEINIPKFGFNIQFPKFNIPMPSWLKIPDLDLPDFMMPDLFYGFVFDLGLNLPFIRIFSSIKQSAQSAKQTYQDYQTSKRVKIKKEVKPNTSELHVVLSDGILKAAKSNTKDSSHKYVTHLADFVSSLIPGGSVIAPVTSVLRTGLEFQILWNHHQQIKAMNSNLDSKVTVKEDETPILRTSDGHYLFTLDDIERFPIVACKLTDVLTVKELFGLTEETADLPQIKGRTILRLQSLQKNKKFTKKDMQTLVEKVFELYYKDLKKASKKIESNLPYSIISNK